eukprot:Gb_00362 [translate_table: standard]
MEMQVVGDFFSFTGENSENSLLQFSNSPLPFPAHSHKRKPLQDITHLFFAVDNARRSYSVMGGRPFVELGSFSCSQNCSRKRKTAHASTNAQQRHERPALRKGFR